MCEAAVRAALMKVDGVQDAKADAKKKSAWIKYDPAKVTPEKLVDVINKNTNFTASLK